MMIHSLIRSPVDDLPMVKEHITLETALKTAAVVAAILALVLAGVAAFGFTPGTTGFYLFLALGTGSGALFAVLAVKEIHLYLKGKKNPALSQTQEEYFQRFNALTQKQRTITFKNIFSTLPATQEQRICQYSIDATRSTVLFNNAAIPTEVNEKVFPIGRLEKPSKTFETALADLIDDVDEIVDIASTTPDLIELVSKINTLGLKDADAVIECIKLYRVYGYSSAVLQAVNDEALALKIICLTVQTIFAPITQHLFGLANAPDTLKLHVKTMQATTSPLCYNFCQLGDRQYIEAVQNLEIFHLDNPKVSIAYLKSIVSIDLATFDATCVFSLPQLDSLGPAWTGLPKHDDEQLSEED